MIQITDKNLAKNKVERFVRRFESSYHLLACHAALPLVLTPELVNYLRVKFLKSEGVPWIAEADLLLSDLCHPVGYELYVMDEVVRAYLLEELEQNEKFGEKRIREIAGLLLNYVKHLAKTNPFLGMKELETQKWGAMLYLDTEQTVREIGRAISECIDPADMARLLKITEDFKKQIKSSDQFQAFLDYAQTCSNLLRKPQEVPPESIKSSYQIAGLELKVPKILNKKDELKTCTFNVASIEILETHTFEFTIATLQRQSGKWVINRQKSQAEGIIEVIGEGIELELMEIPTGTFWMGSPEGELDSRSDEKPQHEVTVPSFHIGRYQVTQAQWKAIAERTDLKVNINLKLDPSYFKEYPPQPPLKKGEKAKTRWDRPVERVNWYQAKEFCDRLSKLTAQEYRLPTEAEWEYACRAGTTTPFHFGETITTDLANYNGDYIYGDGVKGEYRKQTTPVGYFKVANAFGLYDMHGNIWEWCEDDYHSNYKGAPINGSAWIDNDNRSQKNSSKILRGGSWYKDPSDCRSAIRDLNPRVIVNFNIGFRVVGSSPWTS